MSRFQFLERGAFTKSCTPVLYSHVHMVKWLGAPSTTWEKNVSIQKKKKKKKKKHLHAQNQNHKLS